jgi:hypothetical protein
MVVMYLYHHMFISNFVKIRELVLVLLGGVTQVHSDVTNQHFLVE